MLQKPYSLNVSLCTNVKSSSSVIHTCNLTIAFVFNDIDTSCDIDNLAQQADTRADEFSTKLMKKIKYLPLRNKRKRQYHLYFIIDKLRMIIVTRHLPTLVVYFTRLSFYYAPNSEDVEGHIGLGLSIQSVRPSSESSASVTLAFGQEPSELRLGNFVCG